MDDNTLTSSSTFTVLAKIKDLGYKNNSNQAYLDFVKKNRHIYKKDWAQGWKEYLDTSFESQNQAETQLAHYYMKPYWKLTKNGLPDRRALDRVREHRENRTIKDPETGKKHKVSIIKKSLFQEKPKHNLRKTCVWMGIGLGMTVDTINEVLQNVANTSELYACDPQDAMFIYMINKHRSYDLEHNGEIENCSLDDEFKCLLNYYSTIWDESYNTEISPTANTIVMSKSLNEIETDEEFISFIRENIQNFRSINKKIFKYIDDWEKITGLNSSIIIDGSIGDSEQVYHLKRTISRLKEDCNNRRTKKKNSGYLLLTRDRVVDIGLSLRMPIDRINNMLETAGFKTLYPKDIFEGFIIMKLLDIQNQNPDFFLDTQHAKSIVAKEDTELAKVFDEENPYDFLLEENNIINYLQEYKIKLYKELGK